MASNFINVIDLSIVESALWLLACAVIIWRGRPEIALAINFSTIYWTRNMFFIPGVQIAQTWFFMGTLALATAVYMIRDRKIDLTPRGLLTTDNGWLPKHDRWIVFWMIGWWGWMLLLMDQFPVRELDSLFEPTVHYTILTMPTVLLIAGDVKRVRSFALAYIICSIIGVYYALRVIEIPLGYLLQDPGLEGVLRLNLVAYPVFSRFLVIALIFCLAYFISMRRPMAAAVSLLGVALMAHAILLAGARQSMSGALICAALFLIWALRRGGALVSRALAIGALVVFLGLSIYQVAPHLVVRDDEANVEESFNLVGDRGIYWEQGFAIFRDSPVYGSGFVEHKISHNLFVGTLADQGVVGFGFLIGFLIFALRRVWIAWFSPADTELAVFRMALAAIFFYTLIHSQAAGNSAKLPHLYWPIAMLWALEGAYGFVPRRAASPAPLPAPALRNAPALNSAGEQS